MTPPTFALFDIETHVFQFDEIKARALNNLLSNK
jgi:hypothetical protein